MYVRKKKTFCVTICALYYKMCNKIKQKYAFLRVFIYIARRNVRYKITFLLTMTVPLMSSSILIYDLFFSWKFQECARTCRRRRCRWVWHSSRDATGHCGGRVDLSAANPPKTRTFKRSRDAQAPKSSRRSYIFALIIP